MIKHQENEKGSRVRTYKPPKSKKEVVYVHTNLQKAKRKPCTYLQTSKKQKVEPCTYVQTSKKQKVESCTYLHVVKIEYVKINSPLKVQKSIVKVKYNRKKIE